MQEFRRIVLIYVQVPWLSYGGVGISGNKNSPAEGKEIAGQSGIVEMKDFKLRAMLLQTDDI